MYNKNYDRIDYQHHNSAGDIIEALVTPNHPVWAVGCQEHPYVDIEFMNNHTGNGQMS